MDFNNAQYHGAIFLNVSQDDMGNCLGPRTSWLVVLEVPAKAAEWRFLGAFSGFCELRGFGDSCSLLSRLGVCDLAGSQTFKGRDR